jgi:hypothetical protein
MKKKNNKNQYFFNYTLPQNVFINNFSPSNSSEALTLTIYELGYIFFKTS